MLTQAKPGGGNNLNVATLRTLGVLSLFADHTGDLGVTEVGHALGMSKNMAFRALRTLLEAGYLVRDESGSRYVLSPGVLWLRTNDDAVQFDIRELCRPYLERLHRATGESVFLSVIVGACHVTIDSVEAYGTRVSHDPRGLQVPLHASPASRVLLSYLSDAEIEDYIAKCSPLRRFTSTTITDPERLREEVRRVRAQRHARGYGDHYTNGTYVSFPVLDAVGRPHAAVTIGAPKDRLSEEDVTRMLPQLEAIVDDMNREASRFHSAPRIEFE